MITGQELISSLLHLFYPHTCPGCGNDMMARDVLVCPRCIASLPATYFEGIAGNPVEKRFWGRLPLEQASATYFFTKQSVMQHLMHELKYKGNKDLGLFLGRLMADHWLKSNNFLPTALIPLPLHPTRERQRGYNQATLLCQGMAELLRIPVITDAVIRSTRTETQTKRGRVERWQNMEGKFAVIRPELIEGHHVCLVDDVITTGATLEACGSAVLQSNNIPLSVACLCYATRM